MLNQTPKQLLEHYYLTSKVSKSLFCKEKENPENKLQNLFGFKSPATPPQNELLNSFENALHDLIQSVEFKTVRNEFLSKLQKYVENIRSRKTCSFLLIKVQIFTKFHESTMKNFSKIILRKLTKEQVLLRKKN